MTQPAKERTHAVELEYSSQNSRRSKIYIGVGIIVALLVAATVYVALQASGLTEGAEVEMRTVVVAVNDIGSRQPIAEADVTTRELAADPTNVNAFESVDQAVGRVTGVAISAGELVSPAQLASTTEGMTYSILEPGEEYDPAGPDLRAISLTVGSANAVAGTLVPGQSVDLLVTMPINPLAGQAGQPVDPATPVEFLAGPSTKVTLQSLWILARDGDVYILRTDLGDIGEDHRADRRRRHLHDGAPAGPGRPRRRDRGLDHRSPRRGVRLPGAEDPGVRGAPVRR